jgi:hypothetical protein
MVIMDYVLRTTPVSDDPIMAKCLWLMLPAFSAIGHRPFSELYFSLPSAISHFLPELWHPSQTELKRASAVPLQWVMYPLRDF